MADDAATLTGASLIQSGKVGGSNGPNWNLYGGSGPRNQAIHVQFAKPFRKAPQVSIALYGIDILNSANARLTVEARNVTANGFDAVFSTWADTQVWAAHAAWLAHE